MTLVKFELGLYCNTIMYTKPNFFIVGAPRCGTTALSFYLRNHPDIFISKPKELYYFAEDFPNIRVAKSIDQYLTFFQNCTEEHLAIGESSPMYLSSSVAISNIRNFDKNAKIIVMLRNPVDLVHSLHSKLKRHLFEKYSNFETVWRLQNSNPEYLNISKTNYEPPFLRYSEIGKLGSQVEQVLEYFPRKQIKFIIFEDFTKSTKNIYEDVLSFLQVPSDGRSDFPVLNTNRQLEFPRLTYFFATLEKSEVLHSSITFVKSLFGKKNASIVSKLSHRTIETKRKPFKAEFRVELVGCFREEVEKLSTLIDTDLSYWLR